MLQQEIQDKSAEHETTLTTLLDELDKKEAAIRDLSRETEAKTQQITILSTEAEATRKHAQGAKTGAVIGTTDSVS